MTPNILVCIKQVPAPEHFPRLHLDPASGLMVRSGIPSITNPNDRHAIEAALSLKDTYGCKITAITMGPPTARQVLEDALALGVDEGVLLCDSAFAGSDSLSTARIIASGIRALGDFGLILCGNESADGATQQVPPQLAVILNIPHVTSVKRFHFTSKQYLIAERKTDGDTLIIEAQTPVLLALCKGVNEPRLPTVAGIIGAASKNIREMCATDCALAEVGSAGSPTKVWEIKKSAAPKSVQMLAGDGAMLAKDLARIVFSRWRW